MSDTEDATPNIGLQTSLLQSDSPPVLAFDQRLTPEMRLAVVVDWLTKYGHSHPQHGYHVHAGTRISLGAHTHEPSEWQFPEPDRRK
ncbi:MAG TPA: hypothetical protein VIK08_00625 [Candidatus Limnocylindrales bacterium]